MDRDQLQNLSIFLVGMMGCGKSTVGKRLAKRLGYRFFDVDTLIERVAGQSIAQIFETEGEAGFRTWESRVLSELSACVQSVIATGGGAVTQQQNWRYLREGVIIWLDAPVPLLVQRLRGDKRRPLLQGDDLSAKLTKILAERRDCYALADLRIAIAPDDTPDTLTTQILTRLPDVLKDPLRPLPEDFAEQN
jgi:shikimate kinase